MNTDIIFGSYSDANKSREQIEHYNQAWDDFANGHFSEGLEKIFTYISNAKMGNLVYEKQANGTLIFTLYQGSTKLQGSFDGNWLLTTSEITKLKRTSPAILRKLLDRNQQLYFSRIALNQDDTITAIMNYNTAQLQPDIIYYGLREVLFLADELDDLLVDSFEGNASFANKELQLPIPDAEVAVKYHYFQKWIDEALDFLAQNNRPNLASFNSYAPLVLVQRINYLCAPKGWLEKQLAEINGRYWENSQTQELTPVALLNRLIELIQKLKETSEKKFKECMYRTRESFGRKPAFDMKNAFSYTDYPVKQAKEAKKNNLYGHANYLTEYALGSLVYDFNMPQLIIDFYHLQMQILFNDYFEELGIDTSNAMEFGKPNRSFVENYIQNSIEKNKDLSSDNPLTFDFHSLDYTSNDGFCLSLSEAVSKMLSVFN